MVKSVYDPTAKNADAFSMANMVEGTTNKIFTATERTKLSGIATGAEVNVNADWNATEGDAQILNKPTTMTPTAHKSSHAIGGSDPLTATDVGAYTKTEVDASLANKANKTAPTEYDLPLASGIENKRLKYCKTQENIVS